MLSSDKNILIRLVLLEVRWAGHYQRIAHARAPCYWACAGLDWSSCTTLQLGTSTRRTILLSSQLGQQLRQISSPGQAGSHHGPPDGYYGTRPGPGPLGSHNTEHKVRIKSPATAGRNDGTKARLVSSNSNSADSGGRTGQETHWRWSWARWTSRLPVGSSPRL